MPENEVKDYSFKLLEEKASKEDRTEDKTHQKVADTLYSVVNDNEKAVTIGLEGGWGSGKSTVVSLFEEECKKEDSILYFYFDAWAHEGDPLRRVFLESFIDQLPEDYKEIKDSDGKTLKETKNDLSRRERTINTEISQSTSEFGNSLAITTVTIVPLGIAIVSGLIANICFDFNQPFDWFFFFGIIFIFSPFLLAIYWKYLRKKDKDNGKDVLSIFDSSTYQTFNQDISESEEKTSIEFERYFEKVVEVTNKNGKNQKVIIVVDNLDRVNEEDSLKIWSTLQTFLQRKNPLPSSGKDELYNKIFVIVPYDEEGLRKLWDKSKFKEIKNEEKDEDNKITANLKKDTHCSQSFFEKSFQIRLEVPEMILSSWEGFCRDYIKESFIGTAWTEDEKDKVIDIFRKTRSEKSPTPRQLKTYINQIGILRKHTDISISTEAVAYYVVEKHIRFNTRGKIIEHLKKGVISDPELKSEFKNNIIYELSGILHNVNPEKGKELLLEPEIEKAIKSGDNIALGKLIKSHNYAFWTIFEEMSFEGLNPTEFLNNCHVINTVFGNNYKKQKRRFLKNFKTYETIREVGILDENSKDKYQSFLQLVNDSGYAIKNVGTKLYKSISALSQNPPFNAQNSLDYMLILFDKNKKVNFEFKFEEVSLDNWLEIIKINPKILEHMGVSSDNYFFPQRQLFLPVEVA